MPSITTDFLERVALEPVRRLTEAERAAALAAVALVSSQEQRSNARVLATLPSGWRNSVMPPQKRTLVVGDDEFVVAYKRDRRGGWSVDIGEGFVPVWLGGRADDYERTIEVGGHSTLVTIDRSGSSWWVHGPWGDAEIVERSPFPEPAIEEVSGSLRAPMPGKVVSVEVAVGDLVKKGQTLVILEAMKMEHAIGSPEDGTVKEVHVGAGDQVERGTTLVVVEA